MRHFHRTAVLAAAAIAMALPVSSCDDSKHTAKRDQLEAEYDQLTDQQDQLQSELCDPLIPDRGEDLRELEAELDQTKREIAEAETNNARVREMLHERKKASAAWKDAHPLSGSK